MDGKDRKPRHSASVVLLTLALVSAGAYVTYSAVAYFGNGGSAAKTLGQFAVTNATGSLNGLFDPGSIQAAGENGTSVLLTGVSVYNKSTDYNLPLLAGSPLAGPSLDFSNATTSLAPFLREGSLFGAAWNGSAWILTGQSDWGGISHGVLISVEGGVPSNVTGLVGNYFTGGGIWADAWNGSAWLVAGNSSHGAALVSITGDHARDLTAILPNNLPGYWIQLLAWNGTGWMIGGRGVCGLLEAGHYTDILDGSAFSSSGVFAASWNGTAWMIGGGPPASVELYYGGSLHLLQVLPPQFNSWTNGILALQDGWLIGGKGTDTSGHFRPELVYVPYNEQQGGSAASDISSELPASFENGQIQFMTSISLAGNTAILIVGQGHYNNVTGYGRGAVAILTQKGGIAIAQSSLQLSSPSGIMISAAWKSVAQ